MFQVNYHIQYCTVDRKLHKSSATLSTSPVLKSEDMFSSFSAQFSKPLLQLKRPVHCTDNYHRREWQLNWLQPVLLKRKKTPNILIPLKQFTKFLLASAVSRFQSVWNYYFSQVENKKKLPDLATILLEELWNQLWVQL